MSSAGKPCSTTCPFESYVKDLRFLAGLHHALHRVVFRNNPSVVVAGVARLHLFLADQLVEWAARGLAIVSGRDCGFP